MIARTIVIGITSLLLAASAVRVILGFALADRLEIFAGARTAAAAPQVDTVFIGSSHIEYGINPDVFDRRMAAHGMKNRSFNIGGAGLSILESPQHIKKLFELKPCCVKHVFVEPDMAGLLVVREPSTMRAVEFFSAANAYDAISFMESPAGRAAAIPRSIYVGNIAAAMGRHYLNIGLIHADPETDDRWLTGIRGYPASDPYVLKTLYLTEEGRASYMAMLSNMGGRIDQPRLVSSKQVAMVLGLASYLRSKGANLILLLPPQTSFPEFQGAIAAHLRDHCKDRGPALFNFSNPRTYPVLFDSLNRADMDHLNMPGAAIFSTMVADRFAAALADGSLAQEPCRSF
jgi:hypothetical protein